MNSKSLRDRDHIVRSLLNLRDELARNVDCRSREITFKINSCLFSEYPHGTGDPETKR